MKIKAILKTVTQGILLSLFVFGVFSAVQAQPTIKKTYSYRFDKIKNLLKTSTINTNSGQIVVNGEVRQVGVSGGNDGCYTLTVSVYRLAPNGEKILVRTQSKQACAKIDKPHFVFEDVPGGKVIVEIGLDKLDGFKEEKFQADINVIYPTEMIKP
jgi:hypothetical protein